jgi:hypothetical protein
MRRIALATVLVPLAAGAVALACDLFHSTNFQTLCDLDPTNPKCTGDAGASETGSPPQPTNFCEWDAGAALGGAEHACALLGACELPLGQNAFGPCMVAALLAYDCTANPNREIIETSPLHAYWDALWQAKSCADVDRIVFPGAGAADKVPLCSNGGGFVTCGIAYDGGDNSTVRVECDEAGARTHGENCLAQGRTCDQGLCTGIAKHQCTVTGCVGSQLSDCNAAGVDLGTDCALVGNGLCETTDAGPACGSTDPSPCSPSSAVTCDDAGFATGCASGTVETLDCTTLTGSGSCTPGPASPPWDLSSACAADGGACPLDSCVGNAVVSCSQGSTFTVSCTSLGLGPCTMVKTFDGVRAACGPPPSNDD